MPTRYVGDAFSSHRRITTAIKSQNTYKRSFVMTVGLDPVVSTSTTSGSGSDIEAVASFSEFVQLSGRIYLLVQAATCIAGT